MKSSSHDSEVLPNLIMDASRHRLISEACMDGEGIRIQWSPIGFSEECV
jgi:hypothetical protein